LLSPALFVAQNALLNGVNLPVRKKLHLKERFLRFISRGFAFSASEDPIEWILHQRVECTAFLDVSAQVSVQVAVALLSKIRAELTSKQAQIVDTLKRQCPGFAVMRKLVLGFRAILRGGKVTTLHRWMGQARKTGIHSLVRFVRTLKQDLSAVEAAVSEPWSNGPVEGQLNRLKMLKRQIYGRAGIELLRARLLPEPAFSEP